MNEKVYIVETISLKCNEMLVVLVESRKHAKRSSYHKIRVCKFFWMIMSWTDSMVAMRRFVSVAFV